MLILVVAYRALQSNYKTKVVWNALITNMYSKWRLSYFFALPPTCAHRPHAEIFVNAERGLYCTLANYTTPYIVPMLLLRLAPWDIMTDDAWYGSEVVVNGIQTRLAHVQQIWSNKVNIPQICHELCIVTGPQCGYLCPIWIYLAVFAA
jgi:hypothetical protein